MDFLFSFQWQDVVDILVISFLVHRLFLLFRGTTALQILLGVLFLWLCHTIAQASGLVLTSWFFQGVGAVAVLVIVVVFRNEIREVLIQTNPVRLFLGRP
jgi:DNA integrity scanning protein DisA with diadenylate cyclase activity